MFAWGAGSQVKKQIGSSYRLLPAHRKKRHNQSKTVLIIMQAAKVESLPITITGRHVSVTEAMRSHAEKKVYSLNFDYPKVIDAKVLLDVEKDRHKAEIILHCANHIVIEADSTTGNMYTSIDETIQKVARQMRKQKTRMLKSHRPDRKQLRKLKESPFDVDAEFFTLDEVEANQPSTKAADTQYYEDLPFLLHREKTNVRNLSEDEAVEELELNEHPFLMFNDTRNDQLSVIYRRDDGDYAVVCADQAVA